jgi:hypothetical protein
MICPNPTVTRAPPDTVTGLTRIDAELCTWMNPAATTVPIAASSRARKNARTAALNRIPSDAITVAMTITIVPARCLLAWGQMTLRYCATPSADALIISTTSTAKRANATKPALRPRTRMVRE